MYYAGRKIRQWKLSQSRLSYSGEKPPLLFDRKKELDDPNFLLNEQHLATEARRIQGKRPGARARARVRPVSASCNGSFQL
jgi:hypothetical protein